MPNRDAIHELVIKRLLSDAVTAVAVTSAALDTLGFDGAAFSINVGGTLGGTSTYAVTESDDDTTYTAAPATSVLDDGGPLAINTSKRVGYVGNKRYAKLTFTPSASSTVGITGLLILPSQGPTINPA